MRRDALSCLRIAALSFTLALASESLANPLTATMQPGGCDAVKLITTEELGRGSSNPYGPPGPFPRAEEILIRTTTGGPATCAGGPTITVEITNLTGISFQDLVFVVPDGFVLNNSDGTIMTNRPNPAFLIDAVGVNRPLQFESMLADGIFQPGELWRFVAVSSSLNGTAAMVGPGYGGNTLGIGSFDLPPWPYHGRPEFSILANPVVPEPAAMLLVASGASVALARARRRAGS
jgi:hypothetical protein